jgi:hypothetical protein
MKTGFFRMLPNRESFRMTLLPLRSGLGGR